VLICHQARPLCTNFALLVSLSISLVGCVTPYRANTPHSAKIPAANVELDQVVIASQASVAIGSQVHNVAPAAYIVGHYRTDPKVALGYPQLAPTSVSPCSGGSTASTLALIRDNEAPASSESSGTLLAIVRRGPTTFQEPTSFDIPISYSDGRAGTCLRVPVVEGHGNIEWKRDPSVSLGLGAQMLTPFRRIYGVAAAPMLSVRFGPWIGPLRLRGNLAYGGALAEAKNPNLVGYAFGGGALADTLLFSAGRFGLGVAAGYDVTAITFGANINALSHEGTGYRGLIHGPRAGLLFALISEPAMLPSFKRRKDSESATLEVFGAAAWSRDHASATPALWITLSMDGGIP
jgi:hypothetical protein